MIPRRFVIPLFLLGCNNQPPRTQPSPAADRPWIPMAAARVDFRSPLTGEAPLGQDLGLAPGQVPDSQIPGLLAHHFTLPARVGVAILHLRGAQARSFWFIGTNSAEFTQAVADSAVAGVARSARVGRAAALPGLLVGDHPTVASLREAAARLQADVLLVYRPSCRLFDRQPFIGSRQYRSVCTIEAVVLDTRFGVVPFTTVVTREQVTQHQHEDFDDGGTLRRVQLAALLQAVSEVAQRVGSFLISAPEQ